MTAHPVQIVNAGEGHTFTLDEDELNDILLEDNIRNRDVVVISVAGAFRKGKSFLLDFFLRYLYAKVGSFNSTFLNVIITNLIVVCAPQRRSGVAGRRRGAIGRIFMARWSRKRHHRHSHVVRHFFA